MCIQYEFSMKCNYVAKINSGLNDNFYFTQTGNN